MSIESNPVKAQVYTGMWIGLNILVKEKISEIFKIPRNGKVHVFDNRVVEDGWLNEDLARLDLVSINGYLIQDRSLSGGSDLFDAWNILINLIENDLKPKPKEVEPVKPAMNVNVHVTVDESGKVESITSNNETTHVKKVGKKSKATTATKN